MNIEDIKGKSFEVDIINQGKEADRLCYMVYNEELGKFVIGICDCTYDHQFFTNAHNHLFGNASIELSDRLIHDFSVVLNICKDNSCKGFVIFR